ncbi:MAG: hypothetical protein CFH33_01666 [Alphaproteobacteria bacterium MarineAlpha9_Bin3]|nr:MAG: hypothetical protein CFH33_01666 [Alphaproteobacteria bacterium MarineAlpha9_Bin3]|tara:strand:+ start:2694 stop:2882 length:189 start_codon:yes stop_codon:yes gene_type:complete
MSYHPIMGILILILCVFLAYLIGKIITKKNILRWRRTETDEKKPLDLGDASSPDAPWMDDEK